MNYAKSKGEYNEARANLEKIYSEKYNELSSEEFNKIMDEELVTNALGEYFGSEEKLTEILTNMEKKDRRTFIEKAIDLVKDIVNRLSGYKEQEQYFKKIQRQLEKVLNNESVSTSNERLMNIGLKGFENAKNNIDKTTDKERIKKYNDLKSTVKTAVEMALDGKSGKEIAKATNGKWTKNTANNQVIYNISDINMELKQTPQRNSEMKLSDLIKHDELFFLYPELQDIKVITKQLSDQNAQYDPKGIIYLSNKNLDNRQIKLDLVHEIQHAVQNIEGTLTTKGLSSNDLAYYNNILEIEAEDQSYRLENEMNNKKNSILPEVSKRTPVHADIKKQNKLAKVPYAMYNLVKGYGGVKNQNETNKRFLENDSRNIQSNNNNDNGMFYRRKGRGDNELSFRPLEERVNGDEGQYAKVDNSNAKYSISQDTRRNIELYHIKI